MKKIVLSYFLSFLFLITGLYITSNINKEREKETVDVLYKSQVITMPVEEYITGVVSGEMPSDFEEEALKAQAVAARTYLYYKMKQPDKHINADICTDSTHCCAYYSYDELKALNGEEWLNTGYEKIKKCVNETAGEIITYEGEPILAVFHSAAGGGKTENSEDVWASAMPYLRSVDTKGEEEKNNFVNTVTYSIDDFKNRIKESYPNADFSGSSVGEIKKTAGGAVDTVCFFGIVMRGVEARSLFGLKSAVFDVAENNRQITFTVKGSGHGVGMSQYGANYMAKQGKNYTEILKMYYVGTEIEKYTLKAY